MAGTALLLIVLYTVFIGFLIGLLADWLVPGIKLSFFGKVGFGILGSVLGGVIWRNVLGKEGSAGFLVSVATAWLVLFIYSKVKK